MGEGHGARLEKLAWLPVGLASVYGGYFGAGLSVIVLSALGLTLEDSLTRLNALETGCRVQCQCGRGDLLPVFGSGHLVGGAGDGSGRIDRRDIGRQACGSDQTIHAALDSCHDRRDHFHHLFRARINIFSSQLSSFTIIYAEYIIPFLNYPLEISLRKYLLILFWHHCSILPLVGMCIQYSECARKSC